MGDALYTCIKTEHLSSVYTVQCTVLKLWLHCVTLLHCYIVCYTVTLLHCYIVTLLHCYIVCYTVTLTLLHCYTVTLLHCVLHCLTLCVTLCYIVCHIVTLWLQYNCSTDLCGQVRHRTGPLTWYKL